MIRMGSSLHPAIVALVLPVAASAAMAQVDLALSGMYFNQGNNFTTTSLVGQNALMVRARISTTGATAAVAGVDAILRVYAGGEEIAGSPFFTTNGPISAPLSPSLGTLDHTLNFVLVPPQGALQFVVEVDPANAIAESNESNNESPSFSRTFLCRDTVDFAYVSVNYTPGGGTPATAYTDPGIGEGFLRGIYPVGEWNYHRVPFPPLTWSTNINSSNDALLTELLDIRQTDMVAAGYERPDFIYGWLPGNPFSGNGQASGIPGYAAFGNTDVSRFQRTLAHEIGHCFGLQHTSSTLGQVGLDVEHHLRNPLNLGVLHAATQSDVMVAGLLTNQAWVDQTTLHAVLAEARTQCTLGMTGGSDDAQESGREDAQEVVRVAASWNHRTHRALLEPLQEFPSGEPTPDDPDGAVEVRFLNARGEVLVTRRIASGQCRESCASRPGHAAHHHDTSLIYACVPAAHTAGATSLELIEVATGAVLARATASEHAPKIENLSGGLEVGVPTTPSAIGGDIGVPEAVLRVAWSASDPDGDHLRTSILYSPDGGDRWVPIVQRGAAEGVALVPLSTIPACRGRALLKARVQDGFHVSDSEIALQAQMIGNPPDVHIVSPNASSTHPEWSNLLLHASGWDLEDEYLPDAAFVWSSDLDGVLGVGREFPVKHLRPGVHTIKVTGTDSEGLFTEVSTVVTIVARAVVPGDLNGDARVGGADLTLLLGSWGASGRGDIDGSGSVGGGDLSILLSHWTP